jgi:predicted TIM-barrel fold metal-dependent hydrolase
MRRQFCGGRQPFWQRRQFLRLTSAAAGAMFFEASAEAGEPASEESPICGGVWDVHVHLAGLKGTVAQRVATLLRHADRVGVEKIVVHMGNTLAAHPKPDEFRRHNDEVLEAISVAPHRVMGFVYLNPQYQDESLAELDRCVRDGPMMGVKLWIAMVCSRPELDAIARRCAELQVPILQHTFIKLGGNLPDESTPADLAALAARHPQTWFISAHTGGDWERGVRAIRATKNVYAEVSGSDPTAGFVEMAVRELGAQRVMYGSDAPGRSFASQLAKVRGADIPESAKRLVLGENLRRLLASALEKREKGKKR